MYNIFRICVVFLSYFLLANCVGSPTHVQDRATSEDLEQKKDRQALIFAAGDFGKEGDPIPGFGAAPLLLFDRVDVRALKTDGKDVTETAFYTGTGKLQSYIVNPGEYRLGFIQAHKDGSFLFPGWDGKEGEQFRLSIKPGEVLYLGHWRLTRTDLEAPVLEISITEDVDAVEAYIDRTFPQRADELKQSLIVRLAQSPDFLIATQHSKSR